MVAPSSTIAPKVACTNSEVLKHARPRKVQLTPPHSPLPLSTLRMSAVSGMNLSITESGVSDSRPIFISRNLLKAVFR